MKRFWTVNHALSGVIDFYWDGSFGDKRLSSLGLVTKTKKQAETLLGIIHDAVEPFRMKQPPKKGTKYWSFFICENELHAPAKWESYAHEFEMFYTKGIYKSASVAKSALKAAISAAKHFQQKEKK